MDPMALVGVGDLISLVEMLVGVGDLINCTRFAYICGFGNSWRLEDTRSKPIGVTLACGCRKVVRQVGCVMRISSATTLARFPEGRLYRRKGQVFSTSKKSTP